MSQAVEQRAGVAELVDAPGLGPGPFGGGGSSPLARTVPTRTFPPTARAKALGLQGVVVAAAVALSLGGCGGPAPSSASGSNAGGKGSHPTSRSTSTSRGTGGGATSSTTSPRPAPTCSSVPASLVNEQLGFDVAGPSSQVSGNVTTCTYSGTPAQVTVSFSTGQTPSSFGATRQAYTQSGQTTVTASGLGDEAYSVTKGSGQSQTNTLVVLQGSVQLLVTAPASLDDEGALVRQILPSI